MLNRPEFRSHRPAPARRAAGFTLIELIVVVAIIGILASIAISQLYGFAQKAKQSEARELLSTVYTAETAYFAEKNTYGTLSDAGFTPSSTPKYYTNVGDSNFTFTGATSFTGSCSRNIDNDVTMDIWEVTNAAREPRVLSNDIQG